MPLDKLLLDELALNYKTLVWWNDSRLTVIRQNVLGWNSLQCLD